MEHYHWTALLPAHLPLDLIGLTFPPPEAVGGDSAAGCLTTASPSGAWGCGSQKYFALEPTTPKAGPGCFLIPQPPAGLTCQVRWNMQICQRACSQEKLGALTKYTNALALAFSS